MAVSRRLHSFLESKSDFSNWIKQRIKKYGFVEVQYFIPIQEGSIRERPTTEYALTTYSAKELSIVEGNAKGKLARQYFLECEPLTTKLSLEHENQPFGYMLLVVRFFVLVVYHSFVP